MKLLEGDNRDFDGQAILELDMKCIGARRTWKSYGEAYFESALVILLCYNTLIRYELVGTDTLNHRVYFFRGS